MAKYFLALIGILCLLPMMASAVFNDVRFLEDTSVFLTTTGLTLTISGGSQVEEMSVNATNVSFDLLSGSVVTVRSADRKILTANPAIATGVCATSFSYITLQTNTAQTVIVTPGATCAVEPSGGGGGGAAPPIVPTPTVGQGTVTSSGGGTVSATSAEGGGATVAVPANAVAANTTITVTPVGTAQSLVGSPPAGSFMVGGYVYNLVATSAGGAVTTFAAAVTLTFTYTDAQVAGLTESALTVYRWNTSTSQWVALPSTVNTATNTITATTTQFSYYTLMGQKVVEVIAPTTPAVTELKTQMITLIQQIIVLITQLITQLQSQLAAMQT